MRISRLYYAGSLNSGSDLFLDEASAHYLRTVLRLKKSAELFVFNGAGGEFHAQVSEINRKQVVLNIKQKYDTDLESAFNIHFGLAVSRSDRMDWALQKAVELGVQSITPVITERCVVQFKNEKEQQKMRHWQKIVQHAAEQSGRTKVPEIFSVCELQTWLPEQQGLCVFLEPSATNSLSNLTPQENKITLLSGPEGGFTEMEKQVVYATGFDAVKLGSRILRTETAALAAISAVQTLWGDFGNK